MPYQASFPPIAITTLSHFTLVGSHFIFIKLLQSEPPQYAFSTEFSLYRPENELLNVLKVLKRFAAQIK